MLQTLLVWGAQFLPAESQGEGGLSAFPAGDLPQTLGPSPRPVVPLGPALAAPSDIPGARRVPGVCSNEPWTSTAVRLDARGRERFPLNLRYTNGELCSGT